MQDDGVAPTLPRGTTAQRFCPTHLMASSPLLQPRRDVRGVIFPNLRGQSEVGAKEGGAKLGDEFFDGVAFVAEPLAAEVAV
jgi:hypothetical protein